MDRVIIFCILSGILGIAIGIVFMAVWILPSYLTEVYMRGYERACDDEIMRHAYMIKPDTDTN